MRILPGEGREVKGAFGFVISSLTELSTCMMSEWISWSACSVSCGMGMRSRERYVKQYPEDGSLCQLNTEETEKCVVNDECCKSALVHRRACMFFYVCFFFFCFSQVLNLRCECHKEINIRRFSCEIDSKPILAYTHNIIQTFGLLSRFQTRNFSPPPPKIKQFS